MPKKLITDINQGSLELEGDTIDMEDVDNAYQTGADEDTNKTENNQQSTQQPAAGAEEEPIQ